MGKGCTKFKWFEIQGQKPQKANFFVIERDPEAKEELLHDATATTEDIRHRQCNHDARKDAQDENADPDCNAFCCKGWCGAPTASLNFSN